MAMLNQMVNSTGSLFSKIEVSQHEVEQTSAGCDDTRCAAVLKIWWLRHADRPFSNKCFKYLQITISLPSGNQPRFTREKSSKVGDLRILAQKAFGLADFLRLVTAEGHVLNDPEKSLEAAGLSEGDHLTAIAQQGKLAATKEAFAFWSPRAIQDKLGPVRMGLGAFAAILEDGSVVTWGDLGCGGVSSEVQDQLVNVKQLQATGYAFAAILADGSVVTWGDRAWGGDSLQVQDRLRDVRQIAATHLAFAAILADLS